MILRIYTVVLYLMLPLVLLRLLWRSIKAPAYRERIGERLGDFTAPETSGGIWVHAVSVGEVQAITPLIRRLLDEDPGRPIYVTTTTPTGSRQIRRLLGDEVFHVYMPYDLPFALRRFLDRVQPTALLMVETEIWPNLLKHCRDRGIRTLLANARLSERSANRYRRVRRFAEETFAHIDCVAAQNDEDAARFVDLGVRANAISVTGSIKFDVTIPASVTEQAEVERRNWGGRRVWIAGSTHEGEDEIVLDAHKRILVQHPDALLILVPRHPERFDRVVHVAQRRGFGVARRSLEEIPSAAEQVYIGDTMGELPALIGAADVAFIGGSLVNTGGHNMLEAAAQGVPVCFGPHTFNFAVISRMLIDAGGAQRVANAAELAELLTGWFSDPSVRADVGDAGRRLVECNRGALERLFVLVHQAG